MFCGALIFLLLLFFVIPMLILLAVSFASIWGVILNGEWEDPIDFIPWLRSKK